jgi:hypothetical protein
VSTVEIGRPRLNLDGHVDGAGRSDVVERVRLVSTGASDRPEKRPVKGYNGSICLGCLSILVGRPLGRSLVISNTLVHHLS